MTMRAPLAFVLACFAALALLPLLAGNYGVDLVTKIMVYAIFALSLELLVGATGLVCFGQAAFFGIGAYAAVLLSPASEAAGLAWLLPVSIVAAALYALAVGALSLRTKGVYFIMVTLAFAQMVFYLVFDNKALGGSDGLYINFRPDAGVFDLENKRVFYYFTLVCMLGVFVFLRRLLWSPFGRALAGIRVNEHRMRAVGYGSFGYKLAAFTLAGALAGLAGYLWGAQSGFVNPELMGFHQSAHVIMMVILGGMGNFAGAIVGAFAFEIMLDVFKDLPAIGGFETGKHWQLWMGLFIVAVICFAPRGLLGLAQRLGARPGAPDA